MVLGLSPVVDSPILRGAKKIAAPALGFAAAVNAAANPVMAKEPVVLDQQPKTSIVSPAGAEELNGRVFVAANNEGSYTSILPKLKYPNVIDSAVKSGAIDPSNHPEINDFDSLVAQTIANNPEYKDGDAIGNAFTWLKSSQLLEGIKHPKTSESIPSLLALQSIVKPEKGDLDALLDNIQRIQSFYHKEIRGKDPRDPKVARAVGFAQSHLINFLLAQTDLQEKINLSNSFATNKIR